MIPLGHGLIRLALFIRRASMALASLFTVAILVVIASAIFGSTAFPEPFASGSSVSAWEYAAKVTAMIAGVILAGRFIVPTLLTGLAWAIFPEDVPVAVEVGAAAPGELSQAGQAATSRAGVSVRVRRAMSRSTATASAGSLG